MKSSRKIVILILIMAMPISLWTSTTMGSYCLIHETTSHTNHMPMNGDKPMNMDCHETSQLASEQSKCGCNDHLNCSVSVCGAIALMNQISFKFAFSVNAQYQGKQPFANPVYPDLLLRPPIINS